ncbi:YtpI family protein [Halobacillus salinarum]|uniref:YtpI family protein n=1 Tax=Halobacillus salinarum TaxID=2932257 RepID=A0ABY4EPN4_9BACI|nr:YtpI family protein [Halobacillus salinarum]UOQ46159.1 YtpI family protein [Halobacillus salinarum]
MIILSTIIFISLVLYIYYKVMVVKAKDPLTQVYLNSKARLFLGSLVFFFGINQYLAYQTRLSLFIGIVFVVLGAAQFRHGWKASRHYQNEYAKQQSV